MHGAHPVHVVIERLLLHCIVRRIILVNHHAVVVAVRLDSHKDQEDGDKVLKVEAVRVELWHRPVEGD